MKSFGFILTTLATSLTLAQSITSDGLYAKAKASVFRLSTMEIGAHAETGHGTAFAVRADGYLITNFHVVAEAVAEPEKYELQLERPNGAVKATVRMIDAVNDLALVKIESKLDHFLELAPVGAIRDGESFYSFGYPKSEDLTVAQGNFNSAKEMGIAPVFTATIALNPGMSGGPCLNALGKLVAVNRAMLLQAQEISYFSPLPALRFLVDHASAFPAFSREHWRAVVIDEFTKQENQALANLAASSPRRQQMAEASFVAPLSHSCGQASIGLDKSKGYFRCSGDSSSLMGEGLTGLNVTTVAASSARKSQETAPLVDVMRISTQTLYAGLRRSDRMPAAEIVRSIAKVAKLSLDKCDSKNVKNQNGVSMSVRYCTLPVPKFPGLYSTFVKVDVLNSPKTETHFGQVYEGLSMPTTLKLIEYFVDSISIGADA